jgi:hypothetical protein
VIAQPAERSFLVRFGGWLLGGAMAIALVALVVRRETVPPGAAAEPAEATVPAGRAPDISAMTPRERFDRLYQRVITAAERGDQATVKQFTPMAVAAFGQLDRVDADARYHLAMLLLHVGDPAGAKAQADSILAANPDHLFGFVIQGAVARWDRNDGARDQSYRNFLARYDRELATGKPEYQEHEAMLAEVKRAASAVPPARSGR